MTDHATEPMYRRALPRPPDAWEILVELHGGPKDGWRMYVPAVYDWRDPKHLPREPEVITTDGGVYRVDGLSDDGRAWSYRYSETPRLGLNLPRP